MIKKLKTLKDLELYDSDYDKNIWIEDDVGVKHSFKQRQRNCETISIDDLLAIVYEWIEVFENNPRYGYDNIFCLTCGKWLKKRPDEQSKHSELKHNTMRFTPHEIDDFEGAIKMLRHLFNLEEENGDKIK